MEDKKPLKNFGYESALEYKEHGEFFEKFYTKRSQFYEAWNLAYLDPQQVQIALLKMMECITWTSSQIESFITMDEILKRRKKVTNLLKMNKESEALDEMGRFMSEIATFQQKVEILPKVNAREQTDEEKFWMDEEHQGLKQIKKGFIDVLSIKNG